MITAEQREQLRGWFTGRLPDDLFEELTEVTVDREEITVIGRIPGPRPAEGLGVLGELSDRLHERTPEPVDHDQ